MRGAGTLLNIITVLIGGTLGLLLGGRLPERMRNTVTDGLGLVTLTVGIAMTGETQNILIVMGSILLGGILGEWWGIEDRLERVGGWLEARFGGRAPDTAGASERRATFIQGFVTASLVFCVGPMTFLGSLQDGLHGDIRLLAIKSLLDGFAALAFSASLGIGVLFSTVTILLYQGGLTALAGLAERVLTEPMIAEMTAAGGVMIIGIGLILLDLKRIRVANFTPALFIAPLIVAVLDWFSRVAPFRRLGF